MELREKTKYVLGLPGGTQTGLEQGKKLPKDYDYGNNNTRTGSIPATG